MIWIRWGSWLLMLAVALGAFGAHALQEALTPERRQIYQTAVLYQFVHGLGLLAVGWVSTIKPLTGLTRSAGWAFVIGIALFSGSLYLLSVTGLKKLGMITPLGGLAFLIGWMCLGLSAR